MSASSSSDLLPLPLFRRGKVREMYDAGEGLLLMVASDRVSAFDVVMEQPIPGKGAVLTALSAFWFDKTTAITPNHLVGHDFSVLPDDLQSLVQALPDRWLLVRRTERIDVECVVRGYLAGSGWAEYRSVGTLAGEPLPAGLLDAQELPEPRFTPAIKAESGHDENISRARLRDLVGAGLAGKLEDVSTRLYAAARDHARSRGLILADTKFEFGLLEGQLLLIDELLTPDSSRYWPAASYQPGRSQPSFDKQYLRDYLEGTGWNKEPPPPPLPPEVIQETVIKYQEALRLLAGPDAV